MIIIEYHKGIEILRSMVADKSQIPDGWEAVDTWEPHKRVK